MNAPRTPVRRWDPRARWASSARGGHRVLGVAVAAVLATAGCAAGQVAETSQEQATLDGTNVNVGTMALRGLSIQASDASTRTPLGSNLKLTVVIVNDGTKNDQLTGISSSITTGWGSYASDTDLLIDTANKPDASTPASGSPSATPTTSAAEKPITIVPNTAVSYGVPAGGDKVLALVGTTAPVYSGSTVAITFTFAKAGSKTFQVPVKLTGDGNSYTPAPSYLPTTADNG